ncbi:MAG: hypothetical protein ACK5M3_05115 [Dysgonomonas sp.]
MNPSLEDAYMIQPPQVIPSSPQSKLFEKYLNHEVTEYNGLPVIEIPLYEIEIKGLTIPITLSYHAGGVKYMEYDGDVAAGWSVNAGGYRISRTIMGKADEAYPMYKESDFNKWSSNGSSRDGIGYMASIGLDNSGTNDFLHWCVSGTYLDGEYDHFNYMLPGGGGQFLVIDRDDQAKRYIANSNPINKVILTNSTKLSLDDMSIIDGNGFIYYMGKHPVSSDVYAEFPYLSGYHTGWPLRQIKSPYNENIEFNYVTHNVSHDRTDIFGDDYYTFSVNDAVIDQSYPSIWPIQINMANYSFSDTFYSSYGAAHKTYFISEIRTDKEIIEFVRYKYKEEMPYVLKEIKIKTITGSEIKKISFFYNEVSDSHHRLLDRMTIDDQIYRFSYYNILSKPMMYYYSDVWGYYKESETYNTWLNYLDERYKDDYIDYKSRFTQIPIQKKLKDIPEWQSMITWVNRETNGETTHAFSLRKIAYPTGGTTEYIYEPNQYKDWFQADRPIITGAGQRIKKIISRADGTSKPITTIFRYGENENGYSDMKYFDFGNVKHKYVSENIHFIAYPVFTGGTIKSKYEKYNVSKNYSSRRAFYSDLDAQPPIIYSQVAKYQYQGSDDSYNGKTVSFYNILSGLPFKTGWNSYNSNLPVTLNHTSQQFISNYYLGRKSVIDSTCIYNKDNSLARKEAYAYVGGNSFWFQCNGVKVQARGSITDDSDQKYYYNYPEALPFYPFSYIRTTTALTPELLSSKTTTAYDGGKAITTVQSNQYNTKDQLSQTIQTNSLSGTLVKSYKYPQDYSTTPYLEMVAKNMISPVIEQVTLNNGTEIGRIKTDYYKDANNLILPQKVQTSASGINGLRTDIMYDSYDIKGNLLQYTRLDGIKVSYLWSYNYKYPVAEIVNADYSTVSSVLGINTTTLAQDSNPDATTINKIKELSSKLPDTHITTYTYKPLVGMLSSTTPALVSTNYSYDVFGRLSTIKDFENKLINSYGYNVSNIFRDATSFIPDILLATGTYRTGEESYFRCNVEGGEGYFDYNWVIKNATGQVLHSQTRSGGDSDIFKVTLNQIGSMVVSCTVSGKTVSKNIDVKYSIPKIILTHDPIYYIQENGNFTANINGGSGNFTYNWIISNEAGNVLHSLSNSTTNSYVVKLLQRGSMKLTCNIKDNLTQEIYTASSGFDVASLKLSFQTLPISAYQVGNTPNFRIIVTGGSGGYQYEWYLMDAETKEAIDHQTSSLNQYSPVLTKSGPMELLCIVKDTSTGEYAEKKSTFNIYKQVIDLGDKQFTFYGYEEEMIDEIYLSEGAQLEFTVSSSVQSYNMSICFQIGDNDFSSTNDQLEYQETKILNLSPGYHRLFIRICGYMDEYSPVEATIQLNRCTTSGTYVVPSSITARW